MHARALLPVTRPSFTALHDAGRQKEPEPQETQGGLVCPLETHLLGHRGGPHGLAPCVLGLLSENRHSLDPHGRLGSLPEDWWPEAVASMAGLGGNSGRRFRAAIMPSDDIWVRIEDGGGENFASGPRTCCASWPRSRRPAPRKLGHGYLRGAYFAIRPGYGEPIRGGTLDYLGQHARGRMVGPGASGSG